MYDAQREVSFSNASLILGHTVELLTGVWLLSVSQCQQIAAFSFLAALSYVNALMLAEGSVVEQQPAIPVPADIGSGYGLDSAHHCSIVTNHTVHISVVRLDLHLRLASEVISLQLVEGPIGDASRATGAEWLDGVRYILVDEPQLEGAQTAVAVPRIIVQLDAVEAIQRVDGVQPQLGQLIAIEPQQLQVLEAVEGVRGDDGDAAVRQVELGEGAHVAEGVRVDLLDGVVGQGQITQVGHVLQDRGGNGGEQVAWQVEVDDVGQTLEGAVVDLADLAVTQVHLLQVEQRCPHERLLGQRLQVVAGHVQQLGLRVDALRNGDDAFVAALDAFLAALPLAVADSGAGVGASSRVQAGEQRDEQQNSDAGQRPRVVETAARGATHFEGHSRTKYTGWGKLHENLGKQRWGVEHNLGVTRRGPLHCTDEVAREHTTPERTQSTSLENTRIFGLEGGKNYHFIRSTWGKNWTNENARIWGENSNFQVSVEKLFTSTKIGSLYTGGTKKRNLF